MARYKFFHAIVLIPALALAGKMAVANETSYSVNYRGTLGLNTTPTARMDETGTARIGISHLAPHNHAFMGMQIAKPLYINLRQSMAVSSAGQKPDFVYPGMDIKLRLKNEGRYTPEISFGMDSALGHRRHSSEYFALSKRVNDFDFTAGIAWGRLGSAGVIKNPFATMSSHFDRDRDFSSEDAAAPSDWFTGKEIGFFGGIEYFTPLKGLSLKADIGADDYPAEMMQPSDFKKPANWSIGFNYSPKEWVSVGASMIGMDKVMARLTFQTNIMGWGGKSYKDKPALAASDSEADRLFAYTKRGFDAIPNINFGKIRTEAHDISAVVHMREYQPSAMQLGQAARVLLKDAGPEVETITIIPVTSDLRGKAVTFNRRDLEQAFIKKTGSPEEIWQKTSFDNDNRSISQANKTRKFKFIPELSFSFEEETTHLYRASALIEERKEWRHGFITGSSARFNIANNLHRLSKFTDTSPYSIRSDAGSFAKNRINIDRTYLSWMKTVLPDFHFAATLGYLEEMYAGYGGEVLYRPFGSSFAIGAEAWSVYNRDADMPMAVGIIDGPRFTGHLNLFYDIPDTALTTFVKAGQFIGGDVGVSGGAQMQLDNGIKIKGLVSATNARDKDIFESDRNVFAGIQISLPFGHLDYIPQGSEARINVGPIGRNDAAVLDKPESLYEITEPMSYRHLGRNWQAVQN